jgi:hypothetical protein
MRSGERPKGGSSFMTWFLAMRTRPSDLGWPVLDSHRREGLGPGDGTGPSQLHDGGQDGDWRRAGDLPRR